MKTTENQSFAFIIKSNIQSTLEFQTFDFERKNTTQCLWEFSDIDYNIYNFNIQDSQVYDIHIFNIFSTITGCAFNKTPEKSFCLSLDIDSCYYQSNIFSWWWNHIKSSPLLEFYIRICFALMQYIFPISQRSLCKVRCKEINMQMKRNLFRKHDFIIFMKQLNAAQLIWINLSAVICIPLKYYILAFKLIILFEKYLIYYCIKIIFLSIRFIIFGYFNILLLTCFIFNIKTFAFNLTVPSASKIVGGGISNIFTFDELAPFIINNINIDKSSKIKFVKYITQDEANELWATNELLIVCNLPLTILISKLIVSDLKIIAECHHVKIHSKMKSQEIQTAISTHTCHTCEQYISVFEPIIKLKQDEKAKAKHLEAVKKHKTKNPEKSKVSNLEAVQKHQSKNPEQYKASNLQAVQKHQSKNPSQSKKANLKSVKKYQDQKMRKFPPSLPSENLQHTIISNFCEDTAPSNFMKSGCAVCGKLTSVKELQKLSDLELDLSILVQLGVTQVERHFATDIITDQEGPVLDTSLDHICKSCHKSIVKGKMPLMALANGKWLGEVPPQLSDLSFAEQLLIARVRHNRCLVRVSSGMHKMRANAIMFANPMPKIYDILPPPIDEMDDVLAFIYTGPCKPTKADFERIPLLVRRKKVSAALEWLKLNHSDYYDLEISYRNLNEYPEDSPPVIVDYHESATNKNPESTAINDMDVEDGTESGPCPFVVHGLTGEEFSTKSLKAIKAIALQHLTSSGKILAIGHEKEPQSIYHNPQLFPQMMPWLFPYGLGGIGNSLQQGKLSDIAHKRHLLMYHDKRFQMDPHFPLIAFNHEQIKESTTAGYLLAEKPKFDTISKRLMDVDMKVLNDLITRMEHGERVKPETDEEKLCFQLIKDLDHVGGHVKGSITSKKYMRNEIWSLISFVGAPSWFITFSPADIMHPISLYFADTKETFSPEIRSYDERYNLIAHNPVASACFFDFMCQMFIKHVLGVNENHPGFYGNTEAYYGTVEQQGRLTLHMHMLLWLIGCLTPQEIRDKIMDPKSEFQQKIVEYLESVHVGEFLTGSMDEVKQKVDTEKTQNKDYTDPTQTLPEPPPPRCDDNNCNNCMNCKNLESWWTRFKYTVDDLILHSNVHNCSKNVSTNEKKDKKDRPTCINKQGKCKARFPRSLFEQTEVDPKTGALNIKKGEAWINTLSPLVTFLLRCNSDVTSLLSGTAIKAIVAYVSDYITKPGLKTHTIFSAIKNVFDRNSEMLGGSLKRKEKARKILTQTVNCLTSKIEIGGPMASLYLLGNPDHYTGHKFIPVYWKNYVRETLKFWRSEEDLEKTLPEKIVIQKNNGKYVGFSSVHDYMYRPKLYENKTLYEWIQMASRVKISKKHKLDDEFDDELDIICKENSKISSPVLNNTKDEFYSDAESDELNLKDDDIQSDKFIVDDSEDENNDNLSESDDENEKLHSFLKSHPLYKTHKAQFDEKKHKVVPNFIGGSLPRCDRGDREYYCATMLTLFKPWRSGEDLKSYDYSWDETFHDYKFTSRQLQIMKYFNIRYECNDARDDYSSQLKKGDVSDGVFPHWLSSNTINDLDDIDPYDQGGDFGDEQLDDNHYGQSKYAGLGRNGKLRQDEMEEMKMGVKEAGWLDDSPNGISHIDKNPVKPTIEQSGTKWKATVTDLKQQVLAERAKNIPAIKSNKPKQDPNENNVTIVDQEYLSKNFKAKLEVVQQLIDDIVIEFCLNTEQERAFRIVANHAVSPQKEQLKMYLGGMGGTGKSQVIKALAQFFNRRNEAHRFVILGPTGTSAALLGGSTYHSFLGVYMTGQQGTNQITSIAQIKSRLDGVEYIFLDEVSMLACHEMYKISAQLAKALNVFDLPFGGMNMIFAGDFAQLPPVGGASLYSEGVGTQLHAGLKPAGQESAIGKALWHQVTTVVILRENMRQKTQTAEDALLRSALVNMRYGRCTPEDIQFLRTRVAGKRSGQPNVAAKEFRNVAIICGKHTQKDQINTLGCERFAQDTGQKLTNFYSTDKWGKEVDPASKTKWGKSKIAAKAKHKSNDMDFDDQLQVWKVRHGATDNFAGKLSLCLGMPVMIRNNDATELCITKGQEGFVAGWQSKQGPHGKRVLDILFVELKNPPKNIHVPGLPENIVPIGMATKTVQCTFPNDLTQSIERQQLWVLPNFAMTDYAVQGKTRLENVMHLNSCRSHLSYYTCLSRSASAAGTVIIQGFQTSKITRGCSGYLRQEFREHEILDDITKLKYEGLLPDHVYGFLRNPLIRSYQKWKGTLYVPEKTDKLLKWSKYDPMHLLPVITDSPWQMIDKSKLKTNAKIATLYVPAQGSTPVNIIKHHLDDNSTLHSKKKRKTMNASDENTVPLCPLGLKWDGDNYSCAYDAFFSILWNIWIDDPERWTENFEWINEEYLGLLAFNFNQVLEEKLPLELARDSVRQALHNTNFQMFPIGQVYSSIGDIAFKMLESDQMLAQTQLACLDCDKTTDVTWDKRFGHKLDADSNTPSSTMKWISKLERKTSKRCSDCLNNMMKQVYYINIPKLMVFEYPDFDISTSHKIKFNVDDETKVLYLRGIVYHGNNHFTSRIITANGKIWYHDGITTGNICMNEGQLNTSAIDLKNCQGKQLVLAIYAER